jgi:hypothetical protein
MYSFSSIIWEIFAQDLSLLHINSTFRQVISCSDRRQIAGPVKDIWVEGSQERRYLELNEITSLSPCFIDG